MDEQTCTVWEQYLFPDDGIYPNARRENFVELKYLNENTAMQLANIIAKAMHPDTHRRI